MDENKQRNDFTGTIQDKPSGDILNPLTGDYREVDESDDESVCKSNSLWPSISKSDEESDDDDDGEFEKHIPIFIEKSKDENIVYGIVYAPDEVDSQGDQASAEEIEKAANDFMENVQTFKIMHKGNKVKVKVLQSFVAPVDYTIGKRKVKKGSWVLVTRILDKKLWKDIKAGKLTGYSMAGTAKVD